MQSHPLDGDGISFEVFKFLSKVSRSSVSNDKIKFRIPDTVIFSNGCASFWYYFDNGTGSVARRPAKSLDRRTLYDFFAKRGKEDRTDIVAQFSTWDDGQLTGRYMTKTDLQDFLFGPRAPHHGVLQKFIEPREDRNDLIEVVWSPQMTFSVRRINGHRVNDRNVEPTRRCATFDGSSHACEELFCNSTLRVSMKDIADSLCAYFHEVDTKFDIGRMVAFFKQDRAGNVWLLYTTSIRVIESTPDDKRNTTAVSPEEITPRPALVPLLLSMQSLDQSKVERLRRGGKEVVAPPPRRLRGNFMTCAAPEDEEELERASDRRRERLASKREQYRKEQERLFGVLTKLRREVGLLHATLDAGQPVARAKTASPGQRLNPTDITSPLAPSKSMAGFVPGGSASASHLGLSMSSPDAMRQSGRRRRASRSPRRRRSYVVAVPTVSARNAEVEAARLRASGDMLVKEQRNDALAIAEAISDSLYGVGDDVVSTRRGLLNRREDRTDGVTWSFRLPRHVWRWISRHPALMRDCGVSFECPEEDRSLDVEHLRDADERASEALLRSRHMQDLNPSMLAKCEVVQPLPTSGALKRFAHKVQMHVIEEASFFRAMAARAGDAVKDVEVQQFLDELRDMTAERRRVLDEDHSIQGMSFGPPPEPPKPEKPKARRREAPPPAEASRSELSHSYDASSRQPRERTGTIVPPRTGSAEPVAQDRSDSREGTPVKVDTPAAARDAAVDDDGGAEPASPTSPGPTHRDHTPTPPPATKHDKAEPKAGNASDAADTKSEHGGDDDDIAEEAVVPSEPASDADARPIDRDGAPPATRGDPRAEAAPTATADEPAQQQPVPPPKRAAAPSWLDGDGDAAVNDDDDEWADASDDQDDADDVPASAPPAAETSDEAARQPASSETLAAADGSVATPNHPQEKTAPGGAAVAKRSDDTHAVVPSSSSAAIGSRDSRAAAPASDKPEQPVADDGGITSSAAPAAHDNVSPGIASGIASSPAVSATSTAPAPKAQASSEFTSTPPVAAQQTPAQSSKAALFGSKPSNASPAAAPTASASPGDKKSLLFSSNAGSATATDSSGPPAPNDKNRPPPAAPLAGSAGVVDGTTGSVKPTDGQPQEGETATAAAIATGPKPEPAAGAASAHSLSSNSHDVTDESFNISPAERPAAAPPKPSKQHAPIDVGPSAAVASTGSDVFVIEEGRNGSAPSSGAPAKRAPVRPTSAVPKRAPAPKPATTSMWPAQDDTSSEEAGSSDDSFHIEKVPPSSKPPDEPATAASEEAAADAAGDPPGWLDEGF